MAEFQETIFFVQFVILMILFFVRLYNILSLGTAYEWKESIIMFVLSILVYGAGFITSILSYDSNLIIQLFKLETGVGGLITLFFVIEIILSWVQSVKSNTKTSHNAMAYYYNTKR